MSMRLADRPDNVPLAQFLPANTVFALLACCGFGYAIAFHNGMGGPRAFQPLALAGLLLIWRFAMLARRRSTAPVFGAELVLVPLVLLMWAMAWAAWEDPILLYPVQGWAKGRNAQLWLGILVVSYLPGLLGVREPRWLRHLRFAAFALLVFYIGLVVIEVSPHPRIDVWDMQQKAVDILRAGRNPYQDFKVQDTYAGDASIPFVYPPVVLYTGIIAKAIGGDIRYANLVALVATGIGLRIIAGRARPELPVVALEAPALVFWLQPKLFFVLEQAWIDVFQVAYLVVGMALFLSRWRTAGAIVIGVAIASKQMMFWFFPLILLFLPFGRREWIALGATMLALLGPFAVWDFRALKACTLDYHAGLTPRTDALAFMAWYRARFGVWRSTAWFAWSSCFAVLVVGAWRLRGSVTAFGLATTVIYFLFFFFQKWAFANYYFLVSGFAALAAVLALHGDPREPERAAAHAEAATMPA